MAFDDLGVVSFTPQEILILGQQNSNGIVFNYPGLLRRYCRQPYSLSTILIYLFIIYHKYSKFIFIIIFIIDQI